MASSRGVILRNRGAGRSFWRGEENADGGSRYLRKRAKRSELRRWMADYGLTGPDDFGSPVVHEYGTAWEGGVCGVWLGWQVALTCEVPGEPPRL